MPRLIKAILIALLFTGCSQETEFSDQFSGTLPRFEIVDSDGQRRVEPKALFINLLANSVELEGERYPVEITAEDDQKVEFQASFPLTQDVQVSGMTYIKQEEILELKLGTIGRTIRLVQHDLMISEKVQSYSPVDLNADISELSEDQKKMLGILFKVADIMEEIYWLEAFPDGLAALNTMINEDVIAYFRINYGPWDRLNGNLPYLSGFGPKPAGSGFYPPDITTSEFDLLENPDKTSLYTLVTRNPEGDLEVIPYHETFAVQVEKAASLLREASELAADDGFRKYLTLRAEAFLTDDYLASDLAWMDMKNNDIDFIAGPVETYEDGLFGYKAAHESYILLKDHEWSTKLNHLSSVLPELQARLPVPGKFKREAPGLRSDLAVYDAIYYAGDCNAGSKTIAINLPNDERVRARKGTRRLQLKNAIRYKFEEILIPISNVLIAEDQREHVTFDAFFQNTMYHEVAHGLGLKNTVSGSGTVRSALLEKYPALEEGKADVLSLYLIDQMQDMGMEDGEDLLDNYVTFMASIFRSVRFGASSAHGQANMIRFYYFQEREAFVRDPESGTYRIQIDEMKQAVEDLANLILTIQGEGDYLKAVQLVEEKGYIQDELQSDLARLSELNIPVDIVFNQGPEVLGL